MLCTRNGRFEATYIINHATNKTLNNQIMSESPKNEMPAGWLKYGMAGGQTVDLRNNARLLIRNYIAENKLVPECRVRIDAGFKCLLIELHGPFTPAQRNQIEIVIKECIPPDHSYEFMNST